MACEDRCEVFACGQKQPSYQVTKSPSHQVAFSALADASNEHVYRNNSPKKGDTSIQQVCFPHTTQPPDEASQAQGASILSAFVKVDILLHDPEIAA